MYRDALKSVPTVVVAVVGYLFGEIDGLTYALLTVMVTDYATGVVSAAVNRELSSNVGFRGILKKVSVLIVVAVSQVVDVNLLSDSGVLRSSVVAFYVVNESISILENVSRMGVPLPSRLKRVLCQLKDDSNDSDG